MIGTGSGWLRLARAKKVEPAVLARAGPALSFPLFPPAISSRRPNCLESSVSCGDGQGIQPIVSYDSRRSQGVRVRIPSRKKERNE